MVEPLRIAAPPSLRRWAQAQGYSAEVLARWDRFYPDVIGLVKALERPPPRYLRLNRLKAPIQETLTRLTDKGFKLAPTPLEEAWRILEEPFAAGATEEYLLGRYTLQDLSTQLAVPILDPRPGERILDLAAAPGGKTIQMAQAMQNQGSIHAFDVDAERARALQSNLARTGVRNTAVYVASGAEAANLGLQADGVLLDAPCTGEGVIQRDPTRKRIQLDEYARCAADQRVLMEAACQALKPGGRLLYSTCTLAPEENELQVHEALEDLPLRIEPIPEPFASLQLNGHRLAAGLTRVEGQDLDPSLASTLHTLPHLHACLGFYVALLRKEEA